MTFGSKINCIKGLYFFLIHFQRINVLSYLSRFFLLKLISLVLKSVFITKLARANLVSKTPAVNVLNSGLVIYLS